MLSRTPERRMRVVRIVLLLGWLVLGASLLYDPLTAALTSPDNAWSPFHLSGPPVIVQGVPLALKPYPMGNRVFWTMIIPVVPLFLMLFGHEAWRRICPLSLVSQIPPYVRLAKKGQDAQSFCRTGGSHPRVAPKQTPGCGATHYYFQFGFLSLGVLGRILFYDSDRLAPVRRDPLHSRLLLRRWVDLRRKDLVQLSLPDGGRSGGLYRPRRIARLEGAHRANSDRPIDVSGADRKGRPQHVRRLHDELSRRRSRKFLLEADRIRT